MNEMLFGWAKEGKPSTDPAKNLAIDNGCGLTGCSACKDRNLQNICKFKSMKLGYCIYIKFDDYCDNHEAQYDAKEAK
jgi:hypothetical protein